MDHMRETRLMQPRSQSQAETDRGYGKLKAEQLRVCVGADDCTSPIKSSKHAML